MTTRRAARVEDKATNTTRCMHMHTAAPLTLSIQATYSILYIATMSNCSLLWRALVFSASIAVSCRAFVINKRLPSAQHAFCDSRLWHAGGQEAVLDSPVVNKTTATLRTLYPPLEAHRNGTIKVDEMHSLFYQEYSTE